jgi:hypothetical protein
VTRELRAQLAEFAKGDTTLSPHLAQLYERGTVHPDYNRLSMSESYARFQQTIVAFGPVNDPTGCRIAIKKESFPKLVNMKRLDGAERGKATKLLASIEAGDFDVPQGQYKNGVFQWERDRIETLFWIPDLLADPDAIYKNGHRLIQGDRVFMKVYDKLGSKIKLAFTQSIGRNGPNVVITSFLTDPATASSYFAGLPIYSRSSSGEPSLALAADADQKQ